MMLIFLLVLFSSITKESFELQCVYSEDSLEWSLDEFDFDEFKENVDNFPIYDYNDYDDYDDYDDHDDYDVEMCRIQIYIDYKSRSLIIDFGDSFEPSQLDHQELRLDSLIILNNNIEPEYFNILEYACSNYDQCNKLMLFHHIHWLRQTNYTLFQTHLRSLLLNNDNQTVEYCFNETMKLENCSTGVCDGRYFSYNEKYLSKCHQYSEAFPEVHLTTSMLCTDQKLPDLSQIREEKIIRYICKFDQCNDQNITERLINIVDNYFQVSPMKNAYLSTITSTIEHSHTNKANNYFYFSTNLIYISLCFNILAY